MKNLVKIAFLFCVLLCSCKKNETPEPERRFVEGDLIIGLNDNVSIDQVFQLTDSLNFILKQVGHFTYIADYPPDSLPYIGSLLDTKIYLSKDLHSRHASSNKIEINETFTGLDSADLQDWHQTLQLLKLAEIQRGYKNMLVKVPKGLEKYWESQLEHHPYVRYVELNYYGGMHDIE